MRLAKLYLLCAWAMLANLGICQELELVPTESRLPVAMFRHEVVYDGQDSVYIIGGSVSPTDYNDKIIRYSLQSGAVNEVATFQNISIGVATVRQGLDGLELLYFGGWVKDEGAISRIYSCPLEEASPECVVVGDLGMTLYHASLAWNERTQSAYIFGGMSRDGNNFFYYDTVLRYDARTQVIDTVATLPETRYESGVAWDHFSEVAYLFGGQNSEGNNLQDVVKYEPSTGQVVRLPVWVPNIMYGGLGAIYTELDRKVYLIHGGQPMQFNPTNNQVTELTIKNMLNVEDMGFVYVHNDERIYAIAGWNRSSGAMDTISYVQLQPSTVTTTTTTSTIPPLPLSFVVTGSQLPSGRNGHQVVYDGYDAIYVTGGYNSSYFDTVVKYTMGSGEVETLGSIVPVSDAVTFMDGEDILHLGGMYGNADRISDIFRFSTTSRTRSHVQNLPHNMTGMASVWDAENGVAYLFGGFSSIGTMDTIYRYNVTDNQVVQVASLPRPASRFHAVWDPEHRVAYLMHRPYFWKYEPPSTLLSLDVSYPPVRCSFFSDGKLHIVSDGVLIILDTITWQNVTIPIQQWPDALSGCACAYADSLARIYVIGGYGHYEGESSNKYRAEICYINLNTDGSSSTTSTESSTTTPVEQSASTSTLITEVPPTTPQTEAPTSGTTDLPPESSSDSRQLLLLWLGTLLVLPTLAFIYIRRRNFIRIIRKMVEKKYSAAMLHGLAPTEVHAFENGIPDLMARTLDAPYVCRGNVNYHKYNRQFEKSEDEISVDSSKVLGLGEFGLVLQGKVVASGQPVAAKTVQAHRANTAHVKALLSELKILIYVGEHPHIVSLIGARTKQLSKGIVFLFVELCPLGDLESYLRKNKSSFRTQYNAIRGAPSETKHYLDFSIVQPNSIMDLFRWSTQVASAMEYLASKKVVHGDLATRNVLLRDRNCAKVTDFGLAKQMYNYTYCRSGADVAVPWRSMAIESLRELCFSVQSDVWSFGVMLWEIFTLGDVPYAAGTGFSFDFVESLERGLRLPRPVLASKPMYKVMRECWNLRPEQRPTFTQLKELLRIAQEL